MKTGFSQDVREIEQPQTYAESISKKLKELESVLFDVALSAEGIGNRLLGNESTSTDGGKLTGNPVLQPTKPFFDEITDGLSEDISTAHRINAALARINNAL